MLFAASMAAPAWAAAAASAGPALGNVAIAANGAWSDTVTGEESAATCARFQVDAAAVAAFFAEARPVTSRAFNHDLEMSRCHAAGSARLPGTGVVRWFIDAAGRGSLSQPEDTPLYFHRPDPEEHRHAERP